MPSIEIDTTARALISNPASSSGGMGRSQLGLLGRPHRGLWGSRANALVRTAPVAFDSGDVEYPLLELVLSRRVASWLMRVLGACSLGGAGHLGPLRPFLDAAVRAGHETAVVAPPAMAAMVEATGHLFWRGGEPPEADVAPASPTGTTTNPSRGAAVITGLDSSGNRLPLTIDDASQIRTRLDEVLADEAFSHAARQVSVTMANARTPDQILDTLEP